MIDGICTKIKEKYIAINPFINIITNNSVILGKKIIEIVKYFTEKTSKSYYESLKKWKSKT